MKKAPKSPWRHLLQYLGWIVLGAVLTAGMSALVIASFQGFASVAAITTGFLAFATGPLGIGLMLGVGLLFALSKLVPRLLRSYAKRKVREKVLETVASPKSGKISAVLPWLKMASTAEVDKKLSKSGEEKKESDQQDNKDGIFDPADASTTTAENLHEHPLMWTVLTERKRLQSEGMQKEDSSRKQKANAGGEGKERAKHDQKATQSKNSQDSYLAQRYMKGLGEISTEQELLQEGRLPLAATPKPSLTQRFVQWIIKRYDVRFTEVQEEVTSLRQQTREQHKAMGQLDIEAEKKKLELVKRGKDEKREKKETKEKKKTVRKLDRDAANYEVFLDAIFIKTDRKELIKSLTRWIDDSSETLPQVLLKSLIKYIKGKKDTEELQANEFFKGFFKTPDLGWGVKIKLSLASSQMAIKKGKKFLKEAAPELTAAIGFFLGEDEKRKEKKTKEIKEMQSDKNEKSKEVGEVPENMRMLFASCFDWELPREIMNEVSSSPRLTKGDKKESSQERAASEPMMVLQGFFSQIERQHQINIYMRKMKNSARFKHQKFEIKAGEDVEEKVLETTVQQLYKQEHQDVSESNHELKEHLQKIRKKQKAEEKKESKLELQEDRSRLVTGQVSAYEKMLSAALRGGSHLARPVREGYLGRTDSSLDRKHANRYLHTIGWMHCLTKTLKEQHPGIQSVEYSEKALKVLAYGQGLIGVQKDLKTAFEQSIDLKKLPLGFRTETNGSVIEVRYSDSLREKQLKQIKEQKEKKEKKDDRNDPMGCHKRNLRCSEVFTRYPQLGNIEFNLEPKGREPDWLDMNRSQDFNGSIDGFIKVVSTYTSRNSGFILESYAKNIKEAIDQSLVQIAKTGQCSIPGPLEERYLITLVDTEAVEILKKYDEQYKASGNGPKDFTKINSIVYDISKNIHKILFGMEGEYKEEFIEKLKSDFQPDKIKKDDHSKIILGKFLIMLNEAVSEDAYVKSSTSPEAKKLKVWRYTAPSIYMEISDDALAAQKYRKDVMRPVHRKIARQHIDYFKKLYNKKIQRKEEKKSTGPQESMLFVLAPALRKYSIADPKNNARFEAILKLSKEEAVFFAEYIKVAGGSQSFEQCTDNFLAFLKAFKDHQKTLPHITYSPTLARNPGIMATASLKNMLFAMEVFFSKKNELQIKFLHRVPNNRESIASAYNLGYQFVDMHMNMHKNYGRGTLQPEFKTLEGTVSEIQGAKVDKNDYERFRALFLRAVAFNVQASDVPKAIKLWRKHMKQDIDVEKIPVNFKKNYLELLASAITLKSNKEPLEQNRIKVSSHEKNKAKQYSEEDINELLAELPLSDEQVSRFKEYIEQLNTLEPKYSHLSRKELKSEIKRLKETDPNKNKPGISKMMLERIALLREMHFKSVTGRGEWLRLTQLMAILITFSEDTLFNIQTSEGKTLTNCMVALLSAMDGEQAIVLTHDKPLAKEGFYQAAEMIDALGLTAGCVTKTSKTSSKEDVVYMHAETGSINRVQRLIDLDAKEGKIKKQPRKRRLIIDEVDKICMRYGSTSSYVAESGGAQEVSPLLENFLKKLSMAVYKYHVLAHPGAYKKTPISEDERKRIMEEVKNDPYYKNNRHDFEKRLQATQKSFMAERDDHYTIAFDNKTKKYVIKIVDKQGGRVQEKNSHWNEGLHQAVAIKEKYASDIFGKEVVNQKEKNYTLVMNERKRAKIIVAAETKLLAQGDMIAFIGDFDYVSGVTGSLGDEERRATLSKVTGVKKFCDMPRAKRPLEDSDRVEPRTPSESKKYQGIELKGEDKKAYLKALETEVSGRRHWPIKNGRRVYNRLSESPAKFFNTTKEQWKATREALNRVQNSFSHLDHKLEEKQSAIVFFDTITECKQFYEFLVSNDPKKRFSKDNIQILDDTAEDLKAEEGKLRLTHPLEKTVIRQAGDSGRITIATRAASRGTNFKNIDCGFIMGPTTKNEYDQTKARVGRGGQGGQVFRSVSLEKHPSIARALLLADKNERNLKGQSSESHDWALEEYHKSQQAPLIKAVERNKPIYAINQQLQDFFFTLHKSEKSKKYCVSRHELKANLDDWKNFFSEISQSGEWNKVKYQENAINAWKKHFRRGPLARINLQQALFSPAAVPRPKAVGVAQRDSSSRRGNELSQRTSAVSAVPGSKRTNPFMR